MKKFYLLVLSILYISCFSQKSNQDFFFYENKGQIIDQNGTPNSDVKYLFNSYGLNVQIKESGFSYDVYEVERKERKRQDYKEKSDFQRNKNIPNKEIKYKYHRIDIDFVDANKNPEIIAEEKSQDYENYYNLPYKKDGVSFVHRYKKVTYKNLYNNIDLVFFKPEDSTKAVEYNFLVHSGGKMSDIKMKFRGAKTKLKDGKLSMKLRFGEMQENIPNSWIENDKKQNITVNYKDFGNQTFGFESSVNHSDKTIVIDPVPTRIWGSYFGGTGEDYGYIKTDSNNDVYAYGMTNSQNNIATAGAFQNNIKGSYDCFINKITKDGQQKLWGTYYGNRYYEIPGAVDFDSDNNIYFGVTTEIPNPAYPNNGYYFFPKIVLLKLKPNGSLEYEKRFIDDIPGYFFTGYPGDNLSIYDVAFSNNKIYLVGTTTIKSGLSTPGAFQENPYTVGVETGFITQFDINGNLGWSTYFSGNRATSLEQIINAENNYIEVLGNTRASNIPMINPIKSENNTTLTDGLYFKFSDTGTLLYSTYLGDPTYDFFQYARRIGDKVYLSGEESINSVEKGIFYIIDTNTNSILSKKSFRLYDTLQNWTYVDTFGNMFVTGLASPSDSWLSAIPTDDAYMSSVGSYIKSYYIKYDIDLNKIWGTFYGGNGGSQLASITKDDEDNIYFFGMSSNNTTGIATPGAFQQTGGHPSNDMYIAKFKDCSSFAQLNSNSPVCIGKEIQLSAAGGASYLWTGPNGFTSILQNPKIPNASLANSGTYTCAVTGTGGCDTTSSITVFVGDNTKPIPNIANLPKITGDCKTVINTIPTATDNCVGTINGTTTNPLSYSLPGNYTITWTYDDGNGNIATQTQHVEIISQPLPNGNSTQSFCKITNPKISDILVTGNNLKWFDANGNSLNINTLLTNNTKYYVSQTANGCESAKKEILITLSDPNPPTGNAVQDFCSAQNPVLINISINGTYIKWYDNLGNILPNNTPLQNGITYYASQTISGCESTQKLAIKVNVVPNYLSAHDFLDTFCNDTTENYKIINLDDYKKELISNPQDYQFEFRNSANQIVSGNVNLNLGINIFDVKITSSLGCYQNIKLSLTLNPKPKLNLPAEVEFCDNLGIVLDAGSGFSSYQWSSGETSQTILAKEEKTYTVKVLNNFGCQNIASIIVKKAKLAEIVNIMIVNNSATIIMSFTGNYLYSLDNINWQTSNKFENLANGNYSAFVKTVLGCNLGSKNFTIFSLSNIFTPNDDGINDTWKVSGIENYPNSEIKIVDKYGKLVVNAVTNGSFEWDGKFNGRKLPTDSYWYQIRVSDGRVLQGFVVIKNRE